VNHQINTRPTDNKVNKSTYEIYYGKQVSGTASYILGSELLNKGTTEYGIMTVEDLMNLVKLKDTELLIMSKMHLFFIIVSDSET
jgi:hypothetical protein